MKKDCPKAEAIRVHRCSKCGKQGHLEKFCRGESTDGRSQATMKKPSQRSDEGTKPASNKSARRQKVIKEALARLMTSEDDEDEDMQQKGASGDSDEEEGDAEDTDRTMSSSLAVLRAT